MGNEDGVWRKILTTLAASFSAIALGTVSYLYVRDANSLDALKATVSGLLVSVAECRIYNDEHALSATGHIHNIHDNLKNIEQLKESLSAKRVKIQGLQSAFSALERRVDQLYTPGGPGKRYTSDDAAEHERRHELQASDQNRRLEALESGVKSLVSGLHALDRRVDSLVDTAGKPKS